MVDIVIFVVEIVIKIVGINLRVVLMIFLIKGLVKYECVDRVIEVGYILRERKV